jgi:hypothetical protein
MGNYVRKCVDDTLYRSPLLWLRIRSRETALLRDGS